MKYINIKNETSLVVNNEMDGESIETKVERITTMKEPITDGAPLIYTEREVGVQPSYDIRTDRFEVAIDAMDAVTKSNLAKREARMNEKKEKEKVKEIGITEPIQATE